MPMPGRVYLTPSAYMAFQYAKMGHSWPNLRGTVLEVQVPRGADVLIDEDCVGYAMALGYARRFSWDPDTLRSACGFGVHYGPGWDPKSVQNDVDLLEALIEEAERLAPKRDLTLLRSTRERPARGTVRAMAKVGKVVSPRLSPELAWKLLEHGANLAVKPPVKVLGGWVWSGLPHEAGSGEGYKAFTVAAYIPNTVGREAPPIPVLSISERRARYSEL
jgi:hypothetical protein